MKKFIKIFVFFISTITLGQTTVNIECSSYYPKEGQWYIISGWVKQDVLNQHTYSDDVGIIVSYHYQNTYSFPPFTAKGAIIDGWQRIIGKFQGPTAGLESFMTIQLFNNSSSKNAWFDDIRVYPVNGTMKSFVYDEDTQRLMAELDENNFATYYEYDGEGGLVRVKKETERGVYTIQETRSNTVKSSEE